MRNYQREEMTSVSEKSVKLPSFNGEEGNFQIWWVRMRAYAGVMKFLPALGEKPDPNLPAKAATVIDETTADGKLQAKAVQENAVAMANFTMAFTTDGLMQMVFSSMSADWPEGRACDVVTNLFRKYKPQDTMSKVEMTMAIRKVSMKDKEDPGTIFEQLSKIENQFNKKLDLDDKIATIMSVVPDKYKGVLTAEHRAKGKALTLADLEEALRQHYRALSFHQSSKDDGKELGMSGVLTCNFCKKTGHSVNDCFKLKAKKAREGEGNGSSTQSANKSKDKCFHCGKVGHKQDQCWNKPGNESKKPAWIKKKEEKKKEQANGAIDKKDDGLEFVMTSLVMEEELEDDKVLYCVPCEAHCAKYEHKKEKCDGAANCKKPEDEPVDVSDESNEPEEDDEEGGEVSTEVGLVGQAYPDSAKLLTRPEFWIADTGASVHMTAHK